MGITRNFTESELRIANLKQDDDAFQEMRRVADNLQAIRNFYGKSVKVLSGYRDSARNSEIRGSETSQHLFGEAVDFWIPGVDLLTIYDDITSGKIKLPHRISQLILEESTHGKRWGWIHLAVWTDRFKKSRKKNKDGGPDQYLVMVRRDDKKIYLKYPEVVDIQALKDMFTQSQQPRLLDYDNSGYFPKPIPSYKDELESQRSQLSSGNTRQLALPTSVQVCNFEKNDPQKSDTNTQTKPNCKLNSLSLKCGEDVINLTTDSKGNKPLEIISGFNSNKKTIECTLNLVGPCSNHNNKTFDVLSVKQSSNSKLDLPISSVPFYKIFDNGVIFPWEAKTNTYKISAGTCEGNISREVIVYPDIELALDFPIEFETSKEITQRMTNSGKNVHQYEQTSKKAEVKASYKEDGTVWRISSSINQNLDKIKNFKKTTDDVLTTLQKAFDETIKFNFPNPSGQVHFDFKYAKKNEPFQVDSEWSAQIEVKNLFAANATVQLDELLLAGYTGTLSKIYTKIKKALPKNNALTIETKFELIVLGAINLFAGINKKIGKNTTEKNGGGITGKVEADLKASGQLKIVVIISVTGEAGAKTGVTASGALNHNQSDIGVDLELNFLGITFYYQLYVGGAIKAKPNKNIETAATPEKSITSDEITVGATSWTTRIPIT